MTSARLNRRRLLQGVAASTVALPAMGTGVKPVRTASAQAVELEFWTPANDPVGSKIITDLAEGFNSTVGQEQGHPRQHPHQTGVTGDNYVEYTTAMTSSGSPDVVMTYAYFPVISWAANGFIQPVDEYAAKRRHQGRGLLPHRLGR